MNTNSDDPRFPPGADPDPEQPIHVLREQEIDVPHDFLGRVRRSIYRRTTVSQFASYSWHLPKTILIEMAVLLGHLFTTIGATKEPKR